MDIEMKEGTFTVLVILIYSTLYTVKSLTVLPKQKDCLVCSQDNRKSVEHKDIKVKYYTVQYGVLSNLNELDIH